MALTSHSLLGAEPDGTPEDCAQGHSGTITNALCSKQAPADLEHAESRQDE